MTRTENECVDCGLPCIGNACSYRNVERTYCDKCGDEIGEDGFKIDGSDICGACADTIIDEVVNELSSKEKDALVREYLETLNIEEQIEVLGL